jgi:large subunit ribosomal protein L25
MSELELDCEVRGQVGTSAARKLRASGLLPAVIYGREKGPEPVAVAASAFRRLQASVHGHTVVLTLNVKHDGHHKKENVIVKEVAREATTDRVLNIDFLRVSLRERLRVAVPVVLLGKAPGVEAGGVMDQVARELEVECSVTQIPQGLEVDVSQMKIGDVLTAAAVSLPERVTLVSSLETVVATVVPPKVEEAAPVAEVAAEPELIRPAAEEEEEEGESER